MELIELEQSSGLVPVADTRPRMDEPPPVRLVAVDDVRLPTLPGLADALDQFYVELWRFARDPTTTGISYRAENARLRFEVILNHKPIERDGVRPQGIEVPSLRDAERKLVDHEVDYVRQRGLLPGIHSLLLRDPAGNWIELVEKRMIA